MIYLHIGYPKTGSTSIQNAGNINRDELKKYKILYPKSCVVTDGHHNLFYELYNNAYGDASFGNMYDPKKGSLTKLVEEIEKWKKANPEADTLISSEGLFALDEEGLIKLVAQLKTVDDLTLVIVLRRQDYWLRSFWSMEVTRLKTSLSPDEWYKNDKTFRRLNYNRRIREIQSFSGAEEIRVIGFEELNKNIITESFLTLLDPKYSEITNLDYPTKLNRSPSDMSLSFLLKIAEKYQHRISQKDKIDLVAKLHEKSFKNKWEVKRENSAYNFSNEVMQTIADKYSPSNSLMIKKYPNLAQSLVFDSYPSNSTAVNKFSGPSKLQMMDIWLWLASRSKVKKN